MPFLLQNCQVYCIGAIFCLTYQHLMCCSRCFLLSHIALNRFIIFHNQAFGFVPQKESVTWHNTICHRGTLVLLSHYYAINSLYKPLQYKVFSYYCSHQSHRGLYYKIQIVWHPYLEQLFRLVR